MQRMKAPGSTKKVRKWAAKSGDTEPEPHSTLHAAAATMATLGNLFLVWMLNCHGDDSDVSL
jgi:hypothetical protein